MLKQNKTGRVKSYLKKKFDQPHWRPALGVVVVALLLYVRQLIVAPPPTDQRYSLPWSIMAQVTAGNQFRLCRGPDIRGELKKPLKKELKNFQESVDVMRLSTSVSELQGEGLFARIEEKGIEIGVEPKTEISVLWRLMGWMTSCQPVSSIR